MNKTLTRLVTLAFLSLFFSLAYAMPAKPGFTSVPQSDGSTIRVQTLGDEFCHSLATSDGLTIGLGADGDYYYLLPEGITNVRAHNEGERTADELAFLMANRDKLTLAALYENRQSSGKMRSRRAPTGPLRATQVPNNGTPRVPIILVQYTDKAMSNTKAQFVSHYTALNSKSVRQYFIDQSNGLYDPQFDVYGIYTLPSNRATYGANDSSGDDVGVAKMVGDAISKAGNDIDWSQYDNDGDGQADVCIVVYAGVGEAQASQTVPNSVWPCQWSLSSGAYYGDGNGAVTRNGVTIDKFAVFNEVNGSSDRGTTMDGIGTFCHEFSHCLGLPDFYETTYRYGYYGMGAWSLMDSGSYNGITIDGDTPIGYSAYEKNFMGWINYITPVENTQYTLPVFNSKTAENDQAVKITALNANEYWILENRKQQGWDQCIADEGVLITHFTYVADRWTANTVNNQTVQLATIIPADNRLTTATENADLYGETNHAFTQSSSPAMKANMSANGTLSSTTGGAGSVNKPVTEITLNADGTASFWYIKGETPSLSAPVLADASDVQRTSFVATWTHTPSVSCTYTLNVTQGNTTVLNQTGITNKSYTVSGLEAGKTYTFKVKAVPVNASQATESAWSNVKTVTLPLPSISSNPSSVSFTGYTSRTYTQTVNVTGTNLTQNITASLSGANVYSIDKSSLTRTGGAITVTYAPTTTGQTSATLTLSSAEASTVTVPITGTAQAATPTLMVSPSTLDFNAGVDETVSKTFAVTGRFISNDVTLTLTDPSGVFTLGQATIAASNISETNAVNVTVTFQSAEEGDFTGSVTIASNGAQSQTVNLTGSVSSGGTASDAYLDIARYATIDQAGWNHNYVDNIYKYTEYPDDEVAWLTLPVYGAWSGYRYSSNQGPQKWIKSNISTSTSASDVSGSGSWNANDIHLGSNQYFTSTTAKYFGNTSTNAYTERTVSFYVTNTKAVKLLGKNNDSNQIRNYPTTLRVYECTETNGTLNESSTTVKSASNTTRNASFNLSITDLDETKIYKVVASLYRAQFYEIGFQTPLKTPKLTATPTGKDILAEPGQTITETITVTGQNLTEDVTVTLTAPNGCYSVSPTTISAADAMAGATVTVTFNAPEDMGSYRAQVTFTSGTASASTVFYGAVGEKGTAYSQYLDIAKYTTIGTGNWYDGIFANPYKYTEDLTNDVAWLTLPAALPFYAWNYYDQSWCGVSSSATGGWYGHQWTATDVFQGYEFFKGTFENETDDYAHMLGGTNSNSTSNTNIFYGIYQVTNCTQVKAYVYNYGATSSYPAFIQIYELTENADGTLTQSETRTDIQTTYTSGAQVMTSAVLDPGKIYFVAVGGYRGFTYEVAFRTPIPTVTLAELVKDGNEEQTYHIANGDLRVVHLSDDGKKIYCKDDNAFAQPSEISDGQIDYVTSTAGLMDHEWDQSNWIVLTRENDAQWTSEQAGLMGKLLKNVSGKFSSKANPVLVIASNNMPQAQSNERVLYLNNPNAFVVPNFAGEPQTGKDGNEYFFVTPKPLELAQIYWAMWDGDGEKFVVPTSVGQSNQAELQGEFYINMSEYEGSTVALEANHVYNFLGLVKKEASSSSRLNAPARAGQVSTAYTVYPVSGIADVAQIDGGIITQVNDIHVNGAVEVGRYNVAGQRVGKDARGVVLIKMSDGSVRKVLIP